MALKKKTFNEAVDQIKAEPMTEEELKEFEGTEGTGSTDVPNWAKLPPNFKIPPGRVVAFIRLRSEWTDMPAKGEVHEDGVRYRQCIVWNLTGSDEKHAIARTRGDTMRLAAELSKQMVRCIDGNKSDWTGQPGPGRVDSWWEEIGAKCRQLIQSYYIKTHTLTEEEKKDFFDNCIAVRTAG